MLLRGLIVIAGLAEAAALTAQTSNPKAARDAINWEIFQKLYPPRAIAAREEGAVGFIVTLDSKGDVANCQLRTAAAIRYSTRRRARSSR